jgi:hypothetical protein
MGSDKSATNYYEVEVVLEAATSYEENEVGLEVAEDDARMLDKATPAYARGTHIGRSAACRRAWRAAAGLGHHDLRGCCRGC